MKTIAIDARSLEGNKTGVGRYLENILRAWSGKEDIRFVLYFQKSIPDRDFLNGDNFNKKVIGNFWGIYSNFIFQHFLLPFNLIKDKADFFFSPFYLRPLFCPIRSAIVLHDISYEAHPEWFDRKSQIILRALSRVSARKANKIFTVSEFSKSEIVRLYGTNPEKIIVSHLAPDSDFLKNSGDFCEIKKKYNLNNFVLCIGTIFNRRHVDELIDAFAKFSKENNEFQLLIIGKNKTYPFIDIDEKIKEINSIFSENKIIHIDFLDEKDLVSLYINSRAVVYLSDYEGFGLPVVEAQFFGKPVITSHNTSLIEVGGDSVEFVKDNNVDDVFMSLKNVLGSEDIEKKLSVEGGNNLRRFSWASSAEIILRGILKEIN